MNKNAIANIARKIKFGINIPLKVFKKPKFSDSVTSDLFPIRNGVDWTTEFEFLNLPGLIKGDTTKTHRAKMVFFDRKGVQLGSKNLEISGVNRKTIQVSEFINDEIKDASTFAVFHENEPGNTDLGGSFLAERGYTGYKYRNISVKGYVHGNLDAVAYSAGKIENLGNYGLVKKTYFVQHILTGPSEYDFFFTNPTSKKQKLKPVFEVNNKMIKIQEIELASLGLGVVKIKLNSGEIGKIKFKSLLYLARPVVFRLTADSFDVFHG